MQLPCLQKAEELCPFLIAPVRVLGWHSSRAAWTTRTAPSSQLSGSCFLRSHHSNCYLESFCCWECEGTGSHLEVSSVLHIHLFTAERKWVMTNLKAEHSKQGVYKWLASKGRSAPVLQVWACSINDGTEIIPAGCLWLQENSYHPSSLTYLWLIQYHQWGWSQFS